AARRRRPACAMATSSWRSIDSGSRPPRRRRPRSGRPRAAAIWCGSAARAAPASSRSAEIEREPRTGDRRQAMLIGLIVAGAALARPTAPIATAKAPRVVKHASPAAAVETLMPDPGGVIAFGELHQTHATASVRSAIARFTDE